MISIPPSRKLRVNEKPNDSAPKPILTFVFLLAFIFLGSTFYPAQAQQGGERPAPYLELGVGGPQEAMGGAAVGTRNDVACGYWNPAGLTGLHSFQVEDQYTLLPLNQQLNYLAFSNAFLDILYYGLTCVYYSAGYDLEARQGPSLSPDSLFGDNELAFLASVATKMSPRWSVGGNIKLFIDSLGQSQGYGFGEDIGFQYRLTNWTTLGLMARDLYSTFTYSDSHTEIFPPAFRLGIAHREEKSSVKGNFDLEWSQDLGFRPHLGLEWRPMDELALRAGGWMGDLTGGGSGNGPSFIPSGGIGILIPTQGDLIEFDYTVLEDRIMTGSLLHQIALTGKFL